MIDVLNISKEEAKESIKRCAHTQDGKILLAILQQECGFMPNIMSLDDPNKTQVFAAKRGVWALFRKYILPEDLIDIEYRIQITEKPKQKGSSK